MNPAVVSPAVPLPPTSAPMAPLPTPPIRSIPCDFQSSFPAVGQPATDNPVSSTPPLPQCTVITLLRERLAPRNAGFAELDEACLAREDRILELELILARLQAEVVTLCDDSPTLRSKLEDSRQQLTVSRASATSASSELLQLRTQNEKLSSLVNRLRTEVSDLRFELSSAQSSASPAALSKVCAERDRYFVLLHSSFSQLDCFDEDYGNLLTSARDNRSSLRRGIGPLLDEFRFSPEPADEDPSSPRTS